MINCVKLDFAWLRGWHLRIYVFDLLLLQIILDTDDYVMENPAVVVYVWQYTDSTKTHI